MVNFFTKCMANDDFSEPRDTVCVGGGGAYWHRTCYLFDDPADEESDILSRVVLVCFAIVCVCVCVCVCVND